MRNDIRERMEFYVNENIKPNFTALGRTYNADYRTIKKAYLEASNPPNKMVKKRKSKLDPYTAIIDDKLELGCSAMAIFKFIQTQGYPGKYTLVKDYCHDFKRKRSKKATIRVTHSPALSAQVDWKENMVLYDKFGKPHKFNIFLYVLPFSKMKFMTLTFERNQDTLFECLNEAFKYTGGIPKEIWFDNMKIVVDHSKSQYHKTIFNSRFLAFTKDAGFKPIACRPFRPQTKGCVEALARTTERLRAFNYEFETDDDVIKLVDETMNSLNNDISQATDIKPIDLWNDKEKEYLHKLPSDLLNPYFEDDITRIVSSESMVQFRKCKYSVSTQYIGKTVEVRLSDNGDQLQIYYNGALIKSHLITSNKFNYTQEDTIEILQSDLKKNKSEDEIRNYIENNLVQYDAIEFGGNNNAR
ncbi:IS21 family transposase [Companilactobacillus ginsenosidimutans]|uniref:Integrase n=1 Tax=Companilactobacillus ginsenosidimutans TaxID=1007676 RepID=A0A0H4QKJ7_9LACO|nr:IS21 family transposase [Companilactobacillus ginsenosidimutans]AKP66357.1 integrase [Companilactobacillus ginsenosidimutans]AKP66569.1 integrase [Companilactobacillus ginsenosidimutans]AKP67606.1 integrase [Companilactobacillus ginsenosidimutans]